MIPYMQAIMYVRTVMHVCVMEWFALWFVGHLSRFFLPSLEMRVNCSIKSCHCMHVGTCTRAVSVQWTGTSSSSVFLAS